MTAGEISHLIDEKNVRRFGDGNGQDVTDFEQRKNCVLFDEFSWKRLEHLRIEHPVVEPDVRHTEFMRQALQNAFLAAQFSLDDHFAEQLGIAPFHLQRERFIELLGRKVSAFDQ